MGVHRMLLHARELSFQHPVSQERLSCVAGWDAEFEKAMQKMGWDQSSSK